MNLLARFLNSILDVMDRIDTPSHSHLPASATPAELNELTPEQVRKEQERQDRILKMLEAKTAAKARKDRRL